MKVREVIVYKHYFEDLLSGFQKKTQKTPAGEIERAVKLMNEYYEEKPRRSR